MGRAVANARAAKSFQGSVVVGLAFLCAISVGCGNSCVAFFSNPGGGMVSVDAGTCPLKVQDNGNVRLRMGNAPPGSAEAWRRAGIQHIFLTIHEINALLKPVPGEESSEWHDLAPQLKQRPLQIDLLSGTDASSSPSFFDEATLPAGAYTQIRIFLMQDQAEPGGSLEENACATAGVNCVITPDGNIHSLPPRTEPILIAGEQPGGTILYVLRDTTSNLDLQFDPGASQVYTVGQAAWLHPVFSARWTFSSSSTGSEAAVLP